MSERLRDGTIDIILRSAESEDRDTFEVGTGHMLAILREVKERRAAEQPPTPPSGRGEERERIDTIRALSESKGEFTPLGHECIRDLLAFLDSRDAALAESEAMVTRLRAHANAMAKASESPSPTIMRRAAERYRAEFPPDALAAARPFTKEPR